MAPHARRRAVAAALLLRHAATFTYSRPAPRPSTQLRDTYLIDNEDVGGPLEPLSDYLLVKVDETAEKTSGGIMISDKAKEPPPTGVGREHKTRLFAQFSATERGDVSVSCTSR